MKLIRRITVFAAALVLAPPVSAHHSDAGIDLESTVAIEGTVKEYAFRNPHVYVIIESEQSGEPVDWELQMGPVHVSTRLGACAVGRFRLSTVENQIQYFAHSAEIVVICPIFTHGKQRHVGRCPMKIFYGAAS